MNPAEKMYTFAKKALETSKREAYSEQTYPRQIVDVVIFHKLHLSMSADKALKSYQQLNEQFVDWNEVRVSTIREIQETLKGCPASIELAVFIKDFLEFVQREQHRLSLEFLAEENLTDIRRFLKQVNGIDHSTIDLVLYLRKQHPVLPLSPSMEPIVQRLGLVRGVDTRDRKQKRLHRLAKPERILNFHHFLLDISREIESSPEDEAAWTPARVLKLCNTYTLRPRGSAKARESGVSTSNAHKKRGTRKVLRKAVTAKRVRKSS